MARFASWPTFCSSPTHEMHETALHDRAASKLRKMSAPLSPIGARGQSFFTRLKKTSGDLNYGREIIAGMARTAAGNCSYDPIQIVDLGCVPGLDLANVRNAQAPRRVALRGVDALEDNVQRAAQNGVQSVALDIEREPLPYATASIDVVIANQVLEHTKEIFYITAEVARILRPGGSFLIGSPNLASLHSRLMLLLGLQPSPVQMLGPHVRGFTIKGFTDFVEHGGYFRVLETRASNFYLVPPRMAAAGANWLPSMAVSFFLRCERTNRHGRFSEFLDWSGLETPFFTGR